MGSNRRLVCFAVTLIVLITMGQPAQPGPADAALGSGEIVGTQILLAPLVTETVDEMMARDRFAPPALVVLPRETHPEFEAQLSQKGNPLAPAASSWPLPEPLMSPPIGPPSLPQTVGTSFKGVALSEAAGFIPPDTMGDVGPEQILIHVNGRIKVFDKAGVLGALNVTDATFWNSVSNFSQPTYPEVRYDRLSARWVLLAVNSTTPNRVMIAWTEPNTPITGTASFTFVKFTAPASCFADYPSLGIDQNALYIGANMLCPSTYAYSNLWIIPKAGLFAGMGLLYTLNNGIPNVFTPLGVDNDDPQSTEGYFVGTDVSLFSTLHVIKVSTPGGTPTLGSVLSLTVPTTVNPIPQPASGSTTALDVLDSRLIKAAIHKNKLTGSSTLWTAHHIEVDASCVGTSGGGRNGARWYEITGSAPTTSAPLGGTITLNQSGTLCDSAATDPKGYIYPSVIETGQGHMALGSTFASSTLFAGVAVAGRLRTDAAGSTQAPTAAVSGLASYNLVALGRNRWGDYSFTKVDPTDDQTVWTFQEYADAVNSWAVRAVRLKAPPPATPSGIVPAAVCAGVASTAMTLTGTSSSGSEFFDPGPDTGGPGYANHIAVAVTGGSTVTGTPSIVIPGNPSTTPVTKLTFNLNTTTYTGGANLFTVTNPDGQSAIGAAAVLTVVGATPTSNSPVCTGSTLNLSTPTVTGATYSWTGPNGFTSSARNPSIASVTAANAGTYSLTVTVGGVCISPVATTAVTVWPSCDDGDVCTTDTCTAATGACTHTNNTSACDDSDPCTIGDVCSGGVCVVGTGALPPFVGFCGAGVSIPSSGAATPYPSAIVVTGQLPYLCKTDVVLDGITHPIPDDIDALLSHLSGSNALIMSDVGGIFFPVNGVTLTLIDLNPALPDAGPLVSGIFRPTNVGGGDVFPAPAPAPTGGSAFSVFKGTNPNGTWNLWVNDDSILGGGSGSIGSWCLGVVSVCATDADCDDGNACTQNDTCQSGTCVSGPPVVCAPLNQCHIAGTCAPATGVCSNPNAPNGTTCSDGNACTQSDTCQSGTCAIGPPVVCTPLDQCHIAGTCAPTTGVCSNPSALNGTACSDGDPCTIGDVCTAGVCVPGAIPVPVQFCNAAGIAILDSAAEPTIASPYPSAISVVTQGSYLCTVTVDLNGITHTFPDDIDVLLEHVAGPNAVIMSDVGGGAAVVGVSLTLSDSAAASLPDSGTLVSGTFQPTNIGAVDVFPAPAPSPTGGSALSVFTGTNPNGTWNLWVDDDERSDSGTMSGWCVNLVSVCTADADCSDGDPCTNDTCVNAQCTHANNTNACVDGNACTTGDVCGPQFAVDFDGVTAPALPANWTSTVVSGTGNPWVTQSTSSDTAPNSAFGFDGAVVADEVLVSPPIAVTSPTATLTFRNRWSFENATNCIDAGVLEIQIGAGSFTDIVTAGGRFVSGGYTGTVSTFFSNPLASRAAWCNTSAGYPAYLTTIVNLPEAAAGQTIRLRWRIGTDSSVAAVGQNIDSIVLGGTCGGAAIVCNDGNLCTDDSCNPAAGCGFVNNSAACDDGNQCTAGDACSNGSCLGTPAVPAEVDNGVRVTPSGGDAVISWNLAAGASSSSVLRGLVSALPVGPRLGDETCLAINLPITTLTWPDAAIPAVGASFWYLVRGDNVCGVGPLGFQAANGLPTIPRVSTTCP
jgi:subtilisin-like proprotein convertase family protein